MDGEAKIELAYDRGMQFETFKELVRGAVSLDCLIDIHTEHMTLTFVGTLDAIERFQRMYLPDATVHRKH